MRTRSESPDLRAETDNYRSAVTPVVCSTWNTSARAYDEVHIEFTPEA